MSCGEKLSEHWRKFRKDGFLYMLFVEPKREKLRFRKRRCRITDIFLYSNSSDYFVLRLLYNFPIGIALALLVYNLAWYKINFAEDTTLLPTWSGELVKWFIVSCAALTFTLNPLIRCSLILSLASVAASTGQGIISMYVLENAAQGPIRNVMKNFRISTRITICHLKIQAGITKRRIELQAGPLEAVFEKHFGNATSIGKKVIKTLRSLIQPFDDDMEEHSTEEDDQLSAIIDSAKVLADRQLKSLGAEKSEDDGGGAGPGDEQKIDKAAEPAWKRLKSKLGRAIAHRFTRRCQVMFAGSVTSCHKKFEESQSLCYDTVPFPVGYFTCARMNARDLCQPGKIGSISHRFCELGEKVDPSRGEHETLFSSELDQEMNGLQNVSKQIERQLQLNMHFQAVEAPEIERGFALSQLYAEVKHDVNVFEIILDTVRKVFSFLIVMFTYFVFRSAVETTLKYLNDIEYKNYFTTRYFWRIDSVRKGQQRTHLKPLRKEEKKHNKICTAFGCPRGDEVQKLIKSFVRWSVVVFIAVVIVMLDHYFHRMLQIIVENGNVTRIQKGHSRLNIVVNGSGAIAELLRNVMNMNYTSNLDDAVNNAECLFAPSAPDWGFNTRHIIIPLVLMVLLQVFFNVVIQRLVLFYVLGLMFPRRAKSRIVHLYNKILIGRVNLDRLEEADKLEGKKKDA